MCRSLRFILVCQLLLSCFSQGFAADVLFVVNTGTGDTSGDDAVVSQLQNLGHNITLVDDNASATSDANGKDLVIISSTCNSGNVNTKYRDISQPVITWEPFLFDDMNMTGNTSGTDYGTGTSEDEIKIVDGAHPLADGLANGNHSFFTANVGITFGVPSVNADVIATERDNTARATIFMYEPGDTMVGGTASGYRVGYMLNNTSASIWRNRGRDQFNEMVTHVLNLTTTPPGLPDRPDPMTRLLDPVEPLGPSSRRTALVFSEVMYHPLVPAGQTNSLEFIEISNTDPFTVNLSGYRLDGEVDYTFPDGVSLAPYARLVVAASPTAVQAEHGITGVYGPWQGNLSNGGGTLRLENAMGATILELPYDDMHPWPVGADGAGASLELHRPSYGEAHPYAWGMSRRVGGSPGAAMVVTNELFDYLRINEVLVHTDLPDVDYVEIINVSTQAIDIAGLMVTDGDPTNRFVFPAASLSYPFIPIVLNQTTLGFNLSSAGEQVYLMETGANARVIDAMAWPAQENGISYGRTPDGSREVRQLSAQTQYLPNAAPLIRDVVINELMYNPVSGDRNDEYIELYNRGASPVDLTDWRFSSGVGYLFPSGTVMAAGSYLVVAKNQDQLVANYPQLTYANTLGNYSGSLANGGETLMLVKPDDPALPNQDFVEVDRVEYRDGGKWPTEADGLGSSLELIDPSGDNFFPQAWAASDESGKSVWTSFETNGILDDLDSVNRTPNELQLIMLDAGECLVDDVEVRNFNNVDLIPNGQFETDVSGWVIQGNHIQSRHESTEGYGASSGSFHLIASGDGDNGVNRVEIDLSADLVETDSVTLRMKVRWLKGMPRLLMRVHGNMFELSARLTLPTDLGTPGLVNTVLQTNVPPVIRNVIQLPVLPVATEDVVVDATVTDPDGVASVTLYYREDGSPSFTSVPMLDNGLLPDTRSGDKRYTATIPGFADGKMVQYYVEATDGHSTQPRTSVYPDSAPVENALIRFGHTIADGDFHALSLWLTQATLTTWEDRQVLSNELLDGTMVLGDFRVIHNAGARYRGSPWIRRRYTSPIEGEFMAYVFRAPDDDPYLGISSINLDGLEQPDRDDTLQRERMAFWMAGQFGIPSPHQRYVHLYLNGVKRAQVYSDTQQPNKSFLEAYYRGASDGDFFEIDDWFEFNDTVEREVNRNATLQEFRDVNGELAPRRYRWSWERKDSPGLLADDFSGLFELVNVLGDPGATNYVERVRELIDIDRWIGEIALRRSVGDWDGYGFNRGKNTYTYRPPGEGWELLIWDLDFGLGANSRDPSQDVFEQIHDPVMYSMLTTPRFEREYWRHLQSIATEQMEPTVFNAVSDEVYSVLTSNNVSVVDPSSTDSVQNWVALRRAHLLSSSALADADLEILTNLGFDFSTPDSPVTLTGTAPFAVENLVINGFEVDVQWVDANNWSTEVFLASGTNLLVVQGTDEQGAIVSNQTDTIRITYTGVFQELAGNLKLTEIMYHPICDCKDHEFLELKNIGTNTLDLSGVRITDDLQNIDPEFFTFPLGTQLAAGAHLVLVEDQVAFATNYPGVAIDGQLPFNLSNGGETLSVIDQLGSVITEVTYDDMLPWPVEADGDGYSLVSIIPNPTNDQDAATEWQLSCSVGGSPGTDDVGGTPQAPIVVDQPMSQSVGAGLSASFVCSAIACPAPQFQWWRDGEELVGEQEQVLDLGTVTELDTGSQIWCVISNSVGTNISDLAVLTVVPPLTPRDDDCLIAYYLFDEGNGAGTVIDQSGFGSPLNLSLNGNGFTWLAGSNGLRVDSSSSLEAVGGSGKLEFAISGSNAFSIEAWVKPSNTTQSGPARIVSYSLDTGFRNFMLGQEGAGVEFRVRTSDGSIDDNGTPGTLAANQVDTNLIHLVATYAGNASILYRNGIAVTTNVVPGDLSNWNATYDLILANEVTGDRPWLGELHLVAIYCKALDAATVNNHFNLGSDPAGFVVEPPVLPAPEIAMSRFAAGEGMVEWDTVTNAVYRLQWSDELDAPVWQNTGDAFWGSGGLDGVNVTNQIDRIFYRAMQYPQL